MKRSFAILPTLSFLLFCACEPRFDFGDVDFEPQIIVEGWIENGGVPNVILTQSLTMSMDGSATPLKDVPIRWAKVTVSDGAQEEILTGRMDHHYTPPFVYRGSRIRGVAGRTYTLRVEYSGRTLTASTSIPPAPSIQRLEVSRCADSDTLYQIHVSFDDDPSGTNFYKTFAQVLPKDKRYYSSFMGTLSDEVIYGNKARMRINRGMRYTEINKYTPYFLADDTVLVKLTQLPIEGFVFWSDYENEVMNGKNPLFPSTTNLRSNIQGGKGIWCGYGKDMRTIIIKDSIELERRNRSIPCTSPADNPFTPPARTASKRRHSCSPM